MELRAWSQSVKVGDCGVALPLQKVGCIIVWGVWWNGIDGTVYVLVLLRLCGIVYGLGLVSNFNGHP